MNRGQKNIFTVQRINTKETKMDSRIVTCSMDVPTLSKGDNYLLHPYIMIKIVISFISNVCNQTSLRKNKIIWMGSPTYSPDITQTDFQLYQAREHFISV